MYHLEQANEELQIIQNEVAISIYWAVELDRKLRKSIAYFGKPVTTALFVRTDS
jgi:hypothetical protein